MRGYKEEGTTTTPFDMVMLNDLDRFHLVIDVIDRVPGLGASAAPPAPGDGRRAAARPRLDARARRGRPGDPRLGLAVLSGRCPRRQRRLDEPEAARVVDEDGSARSLSTRSTSAPRDVDAVAHRVVHGGARFREPVVIDDAVLDASCGSWSSSRRSTTARPSRRSTTARRALPGRAAGRRLRHRLPRHDARGGRRLRGAAARGASEWGIRRYGFHGLSVQWAAERVARAAARRLPPRRRLLGHGGPRRAVGRDDDGLQPTRGHPDGDPLGGDRSRRSCCTCCAQGGSTSRRSSEALEHESGLLGLSGISARVEELEQSGEPGARLALAVFSRRVAGAVAAMACSLGGLDALVFTGGVGEQSSAVRAAVCDRLQFVGVELDADRNRQAHPDAEITGPGSSVRVVVLGAREDVVAARAARDLLGRAS